MTARKLGRRGASVVLAARGAPALERAAAEVERAGGRARGAHRRRGVGGGRGAGRAGRRSVFGRIDTWVNGAAVSSLRPDRALPVEHIRRVIDIDLIGHVHGIKAVLPQMRRQRSGTIIAISSGLGARAVPLQGPYCAAKAGVIGLMDALRVELEHTDSEIGVTTILPSSINTPFLRERELDVGRAPGADPSGVPPAGGRRRDPLRHRAPGPGRPRRRRRKGLALAHRLAPRATDRMLLFHGQGFARQRTDRRSRRAMGPLPAGDAALGHGRPRTLRVAKSPLHQDGRVPRWSQTRPYGGPPRGCGHGRPAPLKLILRPALGLLGPSPSPPPSDR